MADSGKSDGSSKGGAEIADDPVWDRPAMKVDHPWLALTATLVGLSMIIIDGSVVNVLLPDMINDLGLTETDAQWVNSIYSLLFAALLITVGLMADRYGRRLLFVLGTVVFLIGSLFSGAAQSPEWLIAARAVQAVGASMMLPSSIAVINVMFTGRQRAMAFGFWGAVFGGAAALGPLLGGWLAQEWSWRLAFYINIPIGIIAAILVFKWVPESKGPSAGKIDLLGVLLSAAGLGLIVYGLIEGQAYGWWKAIADFDIGPIHLNMGGVSVAPVAIFVGLVLMVLLVLWEIHRNDVGKGKLIDLELFGIRRYSFGNVVALIVALGEFGILFVLPLWMTAVHGLHTLEIGGILATLAIGTLGAGGAARHVSARFGATNVVRLGMVLEIIGVLGIAGVMAVDRNPWWLAIPLVVYGVGLGFDSAQLTNVVLAEVPPKKSGQASAMTSTFRQIGAALGAAVLGVVLFTGLGDIFADKVKSDSRIPVAEQSELVDALQLSAGQSIPKMEQDPQLAPAVEDAKEAYTDAARLTAFVAAVFIFLGLIFSFGLPKDRREEEPDGEEDYAPLVDSEGDPTPAA